MKYAAGLSALAFIIMLAGTAQAKYAPAPGVPAAAAQTQADAPVMSEADAKRAKQFDDLMSAQRSLMQRNEQLYERTEKLVKRRELLTDFQIQDVKTHQAQLVRFDKILARWEEQQAEYQKYLDSLKK
jgi:hypothetical protein